MKALIGVLLFANLAFYAWVQFVGEPARRAAVPAPGPSIPRLQLASEVDVLRADRCRSIGPFATEAGAERALLWLRSERLEPRLRTTIRDEGTAWWVSVEAPTLQQATRLALRLRAAGVADVEVLPPTPVAPRSLVSLGLYTERERAERRIEELRPYAVTPAIEEQPRRATSWWLDVDRAPQGPALDVQALAAAVPEARGLAVETCPAIAPAGGEGAPPAAPAEGTEAPAVPGAAPATGGAPVAGTAAADA